RRSFISTLLMAWWGAALAVWLYWGGMLRVVLMLLTFVTLAARLAFAAARHFVIRRLSAAARVTGDLRPGVPWVAVGLLVFWCALEATVFTATVLPTLAQALAERVGSDDLPGATAPLVWLFLFLLVMGSFVCVQVLVEAVKKRAVTLIVLSVLIELFVMHFEVLFLYQGFAEAMTPWIVQQTGDTLRPGAWFTFGVARFGWTAVRGTGWILFGQFGTPPLLRLLARQPMARGGDPAAPAAPSRQAPSEDVTSHLGWLRDEGRRLLEHAGVPVLHLLAAALNFVMVVVAARPLFSLPCTGLAEALGARRPGYVNR
ncbi:MAG: hypothetical protein ACREJG_12570, partial [Candidatus Rokuibacteriota bacterium]